MASKQLVRKKNLSKPIRIALTVLMVSSGIGCATVSDLALTEQFALTPNTEDFRSRLYAGVSVGSSQVDPDTSGTRFNVESDSDSGTQLRIGYDHHNRFAFELDTSVLGSAELEEAGTSVKYAAASVSALFYGINGVQNRSRREGFSAFGRLGAAALSRSSEVQPLESSSTVPVLGLGAEYGFASGLGLRAEVTRFDSDVSYVGIGAVYRFNQSPRTIRNSLAEAFQPLLSKKKTTVASNGRILHRGAGSIRSASSSYPRSETRHSEPTLGAAMPKRQVTGTRIQTVQPSAWTTSVSRHDRDGDGIRDSKDNCPDTAPAVSVDDIGCGLFDTVLDDVIFKSNSSWLTPRARRQLDSLAETLLAFPEARVEIRAHTDSNGPADTNLALSSRRAETVVQYLQSRGINELQLRARGLGESQPRDSNGDSEGRKRNRRVDVVTLANLDDAAIRTGTRTIEKQSVAAAVAVMQTPRRSQAGAEPGIAAAKPVEKKPTGLAEVVVFPAVKGLPVEPLPKPGHVPGLTITGVVENVTFETGSANLTDSAEVALVRVEQELKANPTVRIAVMAHTDDQGDAEDNKLLSVQRAEAVVARLVSRGVEQSRLKAEGYGELLPLVQNVTAADRTRNRRVEIRVLR